MQEMNDNSRIDRLKRGLYSRKTPDIIDNPRSQFKTENSEAPVSWGAENQGKFDRFASQVAHAAQSRHTFARKFLTVSILLFVISAIIAGFMFFGGLNTVSSRNVDIEVVGPISVAGGQNVSFDIQVINKNNTDLESTKLVVEYPVGSRSIENLSQELTSQTFDLGTIASGAVANQPISIFLFGEKEEVKPFNITVEYRVKNSAALFYKEKLHEIEISSAPVIITSTYPKEVNSNQDITFSVEVVSNSNENLKDFLVNVQYPFGFSFRNAVPQPSFGNSTWGMDLKQGEKKTIKISGTIVGVDNEERVFTVNSGTASADDERQIGVMFTSSKESILVKKPFVAINLQIGGSSNSNVISGSGNVSGDIRLTNNLPERIFNMNVEATLSGGAFSENSVVAGSGGFFRSADDTIIWDERSNSNLSDLGPGNNLGLDFRLTPLGYQSLPVGAEPVINVQIKVKGERILASGAVEPIELTDSRTLRLATNISIISKVVRTQGNIENSGPIPPKPNEKTTYTIVWSLSNTFNAAQNIEVRGTLPPYVEWTNVTSPNTEDVTYNPVTKEVVWRVPQVPAGTGYKSAPKEVMFQLSFLPSVSQVGTAPELIGVVTAKATDRVTNTTVNATVPAVTTRWNDSSFKEGYDKVTQ